MTLHNRWAKAQNKLNKNLSYHVQDFFNFDVPEEKFSLVYDYTYVTLLHPGYFALSNLSYLSVSSAPSPPNFAQCGASA